MPYLLNVLYLLAFAAALPWFAWQRLVHGKRRGHLLARFLGRTPRRADDNRPLVWLHAVSVGEVNLLAPVIAELRRRRPDAQCVLSATTAAGLELARRKYADLMVFPSPLDFSWAVRRALARLRPDCLVLAELELWPNLIRYASARGTPVAIVNGRLSERSFRGYRRVRPIAAAVLRRVALIAAQNETYARRFRTLGAPSHAVHVTGSVKFDGAQTDRANPRTTELARLAGIAANDVVFLAGSTQEPEEEAALGAWQSLAGDFPRLRLVLVPRHPERFTAVARLLDRSGVAWQRRSELASSPANPAPRVLLVDTVGELGAWWGVAQLAFVGGSLGNRGGQNMIEPAAYGAAVCFGPNTRNFRDIVALLLNHDAAQVVADARELASFLRRALIDPAWAAELGTRARRLVLHQQGATSRTIDLIAPLLPPPRTSSFTAAA